MSELSHILRVLDANTNRFCEGCRVVEEYLRFFCPPGKARKNLAAIRLLRRRLRALVREAPGLDAGLLAGRETGTDPGAGSLLDKQNLKRNSVHDLVAAAFKRMQESGRVLEEYAKISFPVLAPRFKRLRFGAYNLEKSLRTGIRPIRKKRNN